MAELERTMDAGEYRDWQEFWVMDPWGEQRADMRMAQVVWAALQPHAKERLTASEFLLFPDEKNDLPEDVGDHERQWMLALAGMH